MTAKTKSETAKDNDKTAKVNNNGSEEGKMASNKANGNNKGDNNGDGKTKLTLKDAFALGKAANDSENADGLTGDVIAAVKYIEDIKTGYSAGNVRLTLEVNREGDSSPFEITAFVPKSALSEDGEISLTSQYDLIMWEQDPSGADAVALKGSAVLRLTRKNNPRVYIFAKGDVTVNPEVKGKPAPHKFDLTGTGWVTGKSVKGSRTTLNVKIAGVVLPEGETLSGDGRRGPAVYMSARLYGRSYAARNAKPESFVAIGGKAVVNDERNVFVPTVHTKYVFPPQAIAS